MPSRAHFDRGTRRTDGAYPTSSGQRLPRSDYPECIAHFLAPGRRCPSPAGAGAGQAFPSNATSGGRPRANRARDAFDDLHAVFSSMLYLAHRCRILVTGGCLRSADD
jgi:hypothetical protein